MYKPFVRGVLTAVCVSLVLMPQCSYACCFCDWFHCHKEPAPVCPPPVAACNVCPQQVSYVPQTCYRTEYTCVPCTSYRPVSTCDPCAGAQTVMQPVTTYVRRAVQVPYTTYRPVVTQMNYAPAAPCTACGGANYYSPVSAPAAMPSTGCSTCGNGAAAVGYSQPAATYGAPAATYGAPAASYGAPTYMPSPAMGAPSTSIGTPTLAPPPSTSQPSSTFQPNSSNYQPNYQPNNPTMPQDNSSLRPIQPVQPNSDAPSSDSNINSSSAPLLQDPSNRTTGTPLMGPAVVARAIFRTADRHNVVKPAVMEGSGWSTAPKADDGWRQPGN